jgi:signal transduction histidine kinase
MRLLIHELRPVELAEAGLEGALQARLESVEKRSGIEVVLSVDLERPLESELEQGLHRVAQEALNNVVKHSQAQCVKVDVRTEDQKVIMEIMDDGVGFDPKAACEKGGLGIQGMEERARKLEGKLSIDSKPGKGTRVRFEAALSGEHGV